VPHAARPALARRHPAHVTLRVLPHIWSLRSRRSFRIIEAALRGVFPRAGFGVVHFSVQGNHVHVIAEAAGAASLSRGIQALAIRIAKGLNRLMGRRGPVFADRFHEHVLRTPTEVRRAISYVAGNFASHVARLGKRVAAGFVDPYCSTALRFLATQQKAAPPLASARTWLLAEGWLRAPA